MLRWFRADLHVHTCLSPCADLTMSPARIVNRARIEKLDMIAVADHNSAENAGAAMKAAKGAGIRVFPGIEVKSSEEVHILALFERLEDALALQGAVYARLIGGVNKPELFGDQIVANESDEVEGYNELMLSGATAMPVAEIAEKIHRYGGLAIASHIDRPSNSIISQLGFVPEGIELDGLELSAQSTAEDTVRQHPETGKYPLIKSSDAHELDQIGQTVTSFFVAEPTIEEIRKALKGEDGRKYEVMHNT